MMKRFLVFAVSLCYGISWLLPLGRERIFPDLAPKYQEWLNVVDYIILPQEKEVFFKLTNDRERDLFIESFWKQRDPTPGTLPNEFRDEHERRFAEANKKFSRGTSRPGWMTDMGKYYILLGPPASREDYSGATGVVNAEVWFYFGDPAKGLPTHFALVFFQKDNTGEYRLYNPVTDGPASLIENPPPALLSNEKLAYQKLSERAPELAPYSLSLIPGEVPSGAQPSLRSNMLIAKIEELPKTNVNPTYATHFLNFKGIVSTEYLTNYLSSESKVVVLADPRLKMTFLHFALSPQSVSVDYYAPQDSYYCNVILDVSLRQGERRVYEYSKELPFSFPAGKEKDIMASGLSVQDAFPIAPGRFTLTVLYRNTVGKEFSLLEQEIVTEEDGGEPKILGPVIGYGVEDYRKDSQVAFRLGDRRLLIDPKNTLALSDDLVVGFSLAGVTRELWSQAEVKAEIRGLRENDPVQKVWTLSLRDVAFDEMINYVVSLPARELTPDYYDLTLRLVTPEGRCFDERTEHFIVSTKDRIGHPMAMAKSLPLTKSYLYHFALAAQYEALGQPEKAVEQFRRPRGWEQDYPEGIVLYARFLLRQGHYDEANSVLEGIKDHPDYRFEYCLLSGKAAMGRHDYDRAVALLSEGNRMYDSDTELLNALGFSLYKIGRLKMAGDALEASLRLNPSQDEVRRLLEEIRKTLR